MVYCPKVSIIIPVYNGSNFLSESIESALSQTYQNIEIIVVNDGSTDNGDTEKIAKRYGGKIKYFNKENGGVSSALNFAFKRMEGEWFSWLSHDDLYFPDKIKKQVEYLNHLLEKGESIDKITVRTATISIDKNGRIIKIPSYRGIQTVESPVKTALSNVYNYRLSGCSFLIPTSCVKNVGYFREDIRTVSDVEYWYRLLFNDYTFHCLTKERLVKNRSHGKQVGKTKKKLFDKEVNDVYIEIADSFKKNQKFDSVKNFIDLYFGLVKMKAKRASKYVKKKYIKGEVKWLTYWVCVPLESCWFVIIGSFRNVLRNIYRSLFVK